MNNIRTITFDKNAFQKSQPTLLGRILPYLLIISFLPAALKSVLSVSSTFIVDLYGNVAPKIMVVEIIVIAVVQFFVLKLILWIYKKIMGTKPYFYLVGDTLFTEKFYLFYLIRNIIYAGLVALWIYYPMIWNYFVVAEILLSFMVVSLTYVAVSKKIDITFRHMFYKNMMFPWFIWRIATTVFVMIFGGMI